MSLPSHNGKWKSIEEKAYVSEEKGFPSGSVIVQRGKVSPLRVSQFWGRRFSLCKCFSSDPMRKISTIQVLKVWRERCSYSWEARNTTKSHGTANLTHDICWAETVCVCLCTGKKHHRTKQKTGFIKHFLGTELSTSRIGRFSSPEPGICAL